MRTIEKLFLSFLFVFLLLVSLFGIAFVYYFTLHPKTTPSELQIIQEHFSHYPTTVNIYLEDIIAYVCEEVPRDEDFLTANITFFIIYWQNQDYDNVTTFNITVEFQYLYFEVFKLTGVNLTFSDYQTYEYTLHFWSFDHQKGNVFFFMFDFSTEELLSKIAEKETVI